MTVCNLSFEGDAELCWSLLADSTGYGYIQWGEFGEPAPGPDWPQVGAQVVLNRHVVGVGGVEVRDRVVAVDAGKTLVVSHRVGGHDTGTSRFELTAFGTERTEVEITQRWSVSLFGLRIPLFLPKAAAVSRRLDAMVWTQATAV